MGKVIDLKGQRFGSGTVLEEVGRDKRKNVLWKCKCDCGKEYITTGTMLKVGDKKSCGCLYSPDLIGLIINECEIVENLGYCKKRRLWNVKCKCGSYFKTTSDKLKSGHTKSCGCLAHKPEWGSINTRLWSEIKANGKSRNKEFTINREYVWDLFKKQNGKCAISGVELNFAKTNKNQKINREGNASLDRIDSRKGYIEGNVQWVHKRINSMKNNMTEKELINWCKLILKNKEKQYD
jgi:hypothetical protein